MLGVLQKEQVMNKVYIIAEAGVNHNGDISLAKKLVSAAAKAGADAVKFQTFKAENIVSKTADKAAYQLEATDAEESQYEMLKKLELDIDAHHTLIAHCKQEGITFLSTPFDLESADELNQIGLNLFKIPSGELTNLPLLRKIASFQKRIILSTGMATLSEISDSVEVLEAGGVDKNNITVLHCNTEYPTPMNDVNLRAMNHIKDELHVKVGYSDHTLGVEVPIAAVAMGAEIIEKHFTLDRKMEGPDHKASLEPDELAQMVQSIRNIELALGKSSKEPTKSELKNIEIARKSIHALKDLKEGELISEDNITTRRPGNGISPMKWDHIIGKKVVVDLQAGQIITPNDVEDGE